MAISKLLRDFLKYIGEGLRWAAGKIMGWLDDF